MTSFPVFRNDKENEEATVMMADLAFRKNDYEAAMFHFQQLLQKRPDYWVALARFGTFNAPLQTSLGSSINDVTQLIEPFPLPSLSYI